MLPLATTYDLLGDIPFWLAGLLIGIILTYTVCLLGVVTGKTGRSPFWGFVLFLPGAAIVLLAWLAYGKWPSLTPKQD